MSVEEILAQVDHFRPTHVVITGGEPMIAHGITELTKRLTGASIHVTIETAGTVFSPVSCDLMSISPKLSNSTPHGRASGLWVAQHERLRLQPSVLRNLIRNYAYQLKFVVAEPSDMEEIEALCLDIDVAPESVILMAEGVRPDILRERGIWIAEICKQRHYRFSPRLHVDLWGDRRGV